MEHPFFKYFYMCFVAFAFDFKCILDDQMRISRCFETTHRFYIFWIFLNVMKSIVISHFS